MDDCVFCRILAGIEPGSFVYRDDRCAAFMDVQPVNIGHMLIVPIHHAASLADIDKETTAHLLGVAHGLAAALRRSSLRCDGVNVFLADGEAAGQEVPHTHLHVFPRVRGDGFELRLGPDYAIKPRTELDAAAEAIRGVLGMEARHGALV